MIVVYLKNGQELQFLTGKTINCRMDIFDILNGKKTIGQVSYGEFAAWRLVEEGVLEVDKKNPIK